MLICGTVDVAPPRLELHADGFEFYLFNNSGRYEEIRKQLSREAPDIPAAVAAAIPEIPFLFKISPVILVKVNRGAAVMGNPGLQTILVLYAKHIDGTMSVEKATFPGLDPHQMVIDGQLRDCVLNMLPNADVCGSSCK